MSDIGLAYQVARALRGHMRHAGARANPDPALGQRDEAFEIAEADYCRLTGHRGRPPAASAFTLLGREYLFDHAYPLIIHELETGLPEGERSFAAVALANVLHRHELFDHHLEDAAAKLESIYAQLRPIGEPHAEHLALPSCITGSATA